MTFHKHSNIWPHSIPNRIDYTQHSTINIINTTDCSIIVHTNIECAAITICKSYN